MYQSRLGCCSQSGAERFFICPRRPKTKAPTRHPPPRPGWKGGDFVSVRTGRRESIRPPRTQNTKLPNSRESPNKNTKQLTPIKKTLSKHLDPFYYGLLFYTLLLTMHIWVCSLPTPAFPLQLVASHSLSQPCTGPLPHTLLDTGAREKPFEGVFCLSRDVGAPVGKTMKQEFSQNELLTDPCITFSLNKQQCEHFFLNA